MDNKMIARNFEMRKQLHFWAIGDLHMRSAETWRALQASRFEAMFEDLNELWEREGTPAFCVLPGDIIDKGTLANYAYAKQELSYRLGNMPFYPGIGNHEYQPGSDGDTTDGIEGFSRTWGRPTRYTWTAGDVACIMLDHPNPFLPGIPREYKRVTFSQETLSFLDKALTESAGRLTIIFAHCPLHGTVLDRDPLHDLDCDSLDPNFYVENSQEVRAIIAQHRHAVLYFSGHTHSGWEAPQLVYTEQIGNHPLTHVNLMSPWYTGRFGGAKQRADGTLEYVSDIWDIVPSFSVHMDSYKAVIRVRNHRTKQWLGQWEVPLSLPSFVQYA